MKTKNSFKIKLRSQNNFKIFLTVTVFISVIFFIVSSFLDIKIAEFFVAFFKISFFKISAIVTYKLGNLLIPSLLLPTCLTIITLFYLENEKKWKFLKRTYLHRKKIVIIFFTIYSLILFSFLFGKSTKQIIDYFNNFAAALIGPATFENIDIKFLSTTFATGIVDLILSFIVVIAQFLILFLFFVPRLSNNKITTSNYIQPAVVIMIYCIFAYMMVIILKHISGRPLYMNVGWTKENATKQGLNSDLSIEALFQYYGWDFNPQGIGKYSNAQYYEWWQPNNFFKNWINWFTIPENVWIDYKDHYWDMDFPSGHMFSYTIWFATVYFFYFTGEEKCNTTFNIVQKFILQ
ncbi:hypothetical protein CXP39_03730 [Mesoplasma syrphidae]|uniref:Uncharacterized protein n=1 Tax=Mesoplasma syrphidae TaxID=225999 RepID=A0A2K9CA38_9MOLU|nr:hypothetical protein [Mesoplasma syrphidae]AUF83875.1 hypothetical protein CXP39_03730 [Mesoplasma syrphidae]